MRNILILLVCLLCVDTQAQTVVSVPRGDTVVLDTGSVVKLRGITLSQDATQQKRARATLLWMVLDRQVTLENLTSLEWGEQEADVFWKGANVGTVLKSKGYSQQVVQYVTTPPVVTTQQTYTTPVYAAPITYYRQPQVRYYRSHSPNCVNGQCYR